MWKLSERPRNFCKRLQRCDKDRQQEGKDWSKEQEDLSIEENQCFKVLCGVYIISVWKTTCLLDELWKSVSLVR